MQQLLASAYYYDSPTEDGVGGLFDMFTKKGKKKGKEQQKKQQKVAEEHAVKMAEIASRIESAKEDVIKATGAKPVAATAGAGAEGETPTWLPWALGGAAIIAGFLIWRAVR